MSIVVLSTLEADGRYHNSFERYQFILAHQEFRGSPDLREVDKTARPSQKLLVHLPEVIKSSQPPEIQRVCPK